MASSTYKKSLRALALLTLILQAVRQVQHLLLVGLHTHAGVWEAPCFAVYLEAEAALPADKVGQQRLKSLVVLLEATHHPKVAMCS